MIDVGKQEESATGSAGKVKKKIYRGTGDDYFQIQPPVDSLPSAAIIAGNNSDKHFSVTSYSAEGDRIELLVNTTMQYKGVVPVDLGEEDKAAYLEVNAIGPWTIMLYPITVIPRLTRAEIVFGRDDSLLWVKDKGNVLVVRGNAAEKHFSIIAYDRKGDYDELLVNTGDQYSGRVRLPKDALILRITAVGNWSIDLK